MRDKIGAWAGWGAGAVGSECDVLWGWGSPPLELA
jgi:hypothetical protein